MSTTYKVPQLALRMVRERTITLPANRAGNSADVAAIATKMIGDRPTEHMVMILLDGRANVTGVTIIAQGGAHSMSLRPVDVLRAALVGHASAFIIAHNHPSNDPTPSAEDIAFTRKLAEAATVLGLPMLDHVVVTRSGGFASVPFGS